MADTGDIFLFNAGREIIFFAFFSNFLTRIFGSYIISSLLSTMMNNKNNAELSNLLKINNLKQNTMENLTAEFLVGQEFLGFECSMDSMSGTIEWYNEGCDKVIMMTPDWDGDGTLPIDVTETNGEPVYTETYENFTDQSFAAQITKYFEVLATIIHKYTDMDYRNF